MVVVLYDRRDWIIIINANISVLLRIRSLETLRIGQKGFHSRRRTASQPWIVALPWKSGGQDALPWKSGGQDQMLMGHDRLMLQDRDGIGVRYR